MKFKNSFYENIKKNDIYYKAYECIGCGSCANIWPQEQRCALSTRYEGSEANARGLNNLMMAILEDKLLFSDGLVDFVFRCATCNQCAYNCLQHLVPRRYIEALRSALVEAGVIPKTVQEVFNSATYYGNVWVQPGNQRSKWAEGLNIKTASESGNFEYLLFVGDSSSYIRRNQETAKKFVDVLNKAGVAFAFLGNDEKSSGNEILRMGEEGLFQTLAEENIAAFKKYGVKKIVALSPHGFHALKNEYPKLDPDLKIEVVHYTQLLSSLIKEGKLSLTRKMEKKVAYHDSCYLGKHNGIYEEPRDVLRSIPGLELTEMDYSRGVGVCCGGGGGAVWMERSDGVKVEEIRFKQACEMNVDILVTACPICTQQFEAAKENIDENHLEIKDIIELVFAAL